MTRVQLCSGLLLRGDSVLLVRARYPGQPEPLWTLPGGRQETGETIAQTVVREFLEETGLDVRATALEYASESREPERGIHVINCTFRVAERGSEREPKPRDPAIVDVRFVPSAEAPDLLRADVLRIPVAAALAGDRHPRYFYFSSDSIVIPFLAPPLGATDGS